MRTLDGRIRFTSCDGHILRIRRAALAASGEGAEERRPRARAGWGRLCNGRQEGALCDGSVPHTAFLEFFFFFFNLLVISDLYCSCSVLC